MNHPIERDMSGPPPHPPHVIRLAGGQIIPMGAWDPLPPLPTAEEITAEIAAECAGALPYEVDE